MAQSVRKGNGIWFLHNDFNIDMVVPCHLQVPIGQVMAHRRKREPGHWKRVDESLSTVR
jgi:hypothetical protein